MKSPLPNLALPRRGVRTALCAWILAGPLLGAPTTSDVLVYGATPGGFCAAIAAAREGASVVLVEPTAHIGGLSTGGLSHCDSNQMRRETLTGLFDEWHRRVVKDYTNRGLPAPYDPAVKDGARWTFEPHVAMRVTRDMLKEAKVEVVTDGYLKSIEKDGPRLKAITTRHGTHAARVFVDGTYEGDLMAAAGVDWTIGREGRAEYGESLAGRQYPKKRLNISGFDDQGKLLPLVTTDERGPDEVGDGNIMTYSFRLCLTRDPAKRVDIPAPAKYDPARFELGRRMFKAGVKVGFDLYPLPGGKLDGNNSIHGQLSLGWVGACNTWHTADEECRRKIWEDHKHYTLEFLHFLRTDPAVPAKVRGEYASLGFCRDEFTETGHFPPALYVRESRRLKGLYVLTQKDIIDAPAKNDPIAISSFPIDSHDCRRIALKDGGVINEGTIFPVRVPGTGFGYAYHVPYRSVLPRAEQCDNLLVPVALASTHVAMSSLRIEGAWMAIGQGSGVAAALAARQGVAVQDLPYPDLRERLLTQGMTLQLPGAPAKKDIAVPNAAESQTGILLDDSQAEMAGDWTLSTIFKPFIGEGYRVAGAKDTPGDGKSSATFRFKAPASGEHTLLMAYSAHETRAQNVPVILTQGGKETRFTVDQTIPLPSEQAFRTIGMATLVAGMDATLRVQNTGTTGFVILDALMVKVSPQPPQP